jgi:hypothetical protein
MIVIKTIFALFLIAHGLVHLLWFVVPWQITEVDGLPYSTTILGGRLDLGAGGIRFYGLLWIVPTVAFVLAGIGLLFSAPWWWTLTLGAVAISFLLCILRLPVAKWGALIDVLIAAVLLLGNQYGLTFLPFPAVT